MWRESALRNLLLEEICNLPRAEESASGSTGESDGDRLLRKACHRAGLVVAADWAALLVLLLLSDSDRAWLPFGQTEDSILTLGVLILAVHSGFRLGQLEKLRAVSRLIDDLKNRVGG